MKVVSLEAGDEQMPFEDAVEMVPVHLSNKWFDYKGWKNLAAVITDYNPDIVQANAADTLKYAVLSKIIMRWKQPVVYRNASVMSRYSARWVSKQLIRFLLGRVSHIASVSAASQEDLISSFGVASVKITQIPVGVDLHSGNPVTEMHDGLNIVHVGGFTFEKNHQGLLNILERVLKSLPDVKLWLIGDGPLRNRIEDEVIKRKLEPNVHFAGSVKNPMDFIRSAKALVLPSIIEGLPAVVLEAFACETPVIAYAVGGIPEVLSGQTGWLIDKNDEEDFAQNLVQVLVADAIDKTERLEKAKQLVMERYDNTAIAVKFEALYTSLK